MKPSFWVKIGSYLADIQIEEAESAFSGRLEVICRKGKFALCTDNAVYSYDELYLNFRESFGRIDLDHYQIKNALILGLGLGSVPLLLEKIFKKKYNYTLVEIDQKIVDLATKYTLNDLQSSTKVVCDNALEYVKNCSEQFDFVAIDIFIDDQVPSEFESFDFLNNIKKVLSPNALLMYNRLTYNEALASKTTAFFDNKFSKVFEEAVALKLDGNNMLLNRFVAKG